MPSRRFPQPWSVDDPDTKLGQDCFTIRDANGQALVLLQAAGLETAKAAGSDAARNGFRPSRSPAPITPVIDGAELHHSAGTTRLH